MGAPLAAKRSDAEFNLLDIADYSLPLLDEALPPAVTPKEHTTGVGKLIGSRSRPAAVNPPPWPYSRPTPDQSPPPTPTNDRSVGVSAAGLPLVLAVRVRRRASTSADLALSGGGGLEQVLDQHEVDLGWVAEAKAAFAHGLGGQVGGEGIPDVRA